MALTLAISCVVGLVVALILSQAVDSVVATWVAGSTGFVILVMVGVLGARSVISLGQKQKMSRLGWTVLSAQASPDSSW
ncbi:MAG TPA: hypothetical protein H9881_06800 [Candidatus Stackebrandtia excrementipullorum]|nr:hypothetical protein [Candidatus Stackebrandtia excrementipullorum]